MRLSILLVEPQRKSKSKTKVRFGGANQTLPGIEAETAHACWQLPRNEETVVKPTTFSV